MIYKFEDLTIGQVKELTEQFLQDNSGFETPEALLKKNRECNEGVFE